MGESSVEGERKKDEQRKISSSIKNIKKKKQINYVKIYAKDMIK